jgi:hypothetical protein
MEAKKQVFDDPRYFPSQDNPPDIGDFQDNTERQRYIAFGLEGDPAVLQLVDELGIVYQLSCLHFDSAVLITENWLGLAFNRMGFIIHGQMLHKMLTPLKSIKVSWIHTYMEEAHFIAFESKDVTTELDVYGVVVTSISRYPIVMYEEHLNDMITTHRKQMTGK